MERIKEEILLIRQAEEKDQPKAWSTSDLDDIPSVLIDFFLWDLAKELESEDADGEESADAIASAPVSRDPLPAAHRTRSIWY